jgi:hypothetical protein
MLLNYVYTQRRKIGIHDVNKTVDLKTKAKLNAGKYNSNFASHKPQNLRGNPATYTSKNALSRYDCKMNYRGI